MGLSSLSIHSKHALAFGGQSQILWSGIVPLGIETQMGSKAAFHPPHLWTAHPANGHAIKCIRPALNGLAAEAVHFQRWTSNFQRKVTVQRAFHNSRRTFLSATAPRDPATVEAESTHPSHSFDSASNAIQTNTTRGPSDPRRALQPPPTRQTQSCALQVKPSHS